MRGFFHKIKRYLDFKRRNITVWWPANIYPTARIGDNVSIGMFTEIGDQVQIGDNTRVGMGVFIPDGVKIGSNCFIGPKTTFSNDMYPPSPKEYWQRTVIEDFVSIGANCSIRPGVTVKEGSLIGMGSVVCMNIPGHEVWAGNPSKKLRVNPNHYNRGTKWAQADQQTSTLRDRKSSIRR